MAELPTFSRSNYASNAYVVGVAGGLQAPHAVEATTATTPLQMRCYQPSGMTTIPQLFRGYQATDFSAPFELDLQEIATQEIAKTDSKPKKENAVAKEETPNRRLVQVFIADPNENIPLQDSVLYRGEQKLTDLTDQELFFELDIKDMLAKHNAKRVSFIDKKVKERKEHLEPAKIRDLKMIVVTIATF